MKMSENIKIYSFVFNHLVYITPDEKTHEFRNKSMDEIDAFLKKIGILKKK